MVADAISVLNAGQCCLPAIMVSTPRVRYPRVSLDIHPDGHLAVEAEVADQFGVHHMMVNGRWFNSLMVSLELVLKPKWRAEPEWRAADLGCLDPVPFCKWPQSIVADSNLVMKRLKDAHPEPRQEQVGVPGWVREVRRLPAGEIVFVKPSSTHGNSDSVVIVSLPLLSQSVDAGQRSMLKTLLGQSVDAGQRSMLKMDDKDKPKMTRSMLKMTMRSKKRTRVVDPPASSLDSFRGVDDVRLDLASSVKRTQSPPRKRVKQVSSRSRKLESGGTARRACLVTCCPKYLSLPAPERQDTLVHTSDVFRKMLDLNGRLKVVVQAGLLLRCSEVKPLSVCGSNSSVCVRAQDTEGGAEHLVCHLVTEHDHKARAAAEAVLSLVIDQAPVEPIEVVEVVMID